jgi:hypothetical protein
MFLLDAHLMHDFSCFIDICNGFVFSVVLEKQHSLEKNIVELVEFFYYNINKSIFIFDLFRVVI